MTRMPHKLAAGGAGRGGALPDELPYYFLGQGAASNLVIVFLKKNRFLQLSLFHSCKILGSFHS